MLKRIVCALVALALVSGGALAFADRLDVQKEKLSVFYEGLVALGLFPEGSTLPEENVLEDGTLSYPFSDYLVIDASEDEDGYSLYTLNMMLADAPDDEETLRSLYGLFLAAVVPELSVEDADARIAAALEDLHPITEYAAMAFDEGEEYVLWIFSMLTEAVILLEVRLFY